MTTTPLVLDQDYITIDPEIIPEWSCWWKRNDDTWKKKKGGGGREKEMKGKKKNLSSPYAIEYDFGRSL
jgi:hypothetical protein